MMKRSERRWPQALVLLASMTTIVSLRAYGASPTTSAISGKLDLSIPAQPLEAALLEFSRQTGLHVILYSDYGNGVNSLRLSGRYTPTQALDALLAHTGLRYEYLDPQSIAVFSTPSSKPGPTDAVGAATGAGYGFTRLADVTPADSPKPSQTASDSGDNPTFDSPTTIERKGIPEILVQGSRILNMDIKRSADDAQPYVIYDHAAIEQSGAQNLEDFFRRRTTLAVDFQSNSQLNSSASGGGSSSSINLRGLGANQTLILIDGRRMADTSVGLTTAQPDLNGIPLAAIERIEILPTTASGIYGGSATGGVINIVLRRDYSGVETKLTYGSSFDGGAANRRAEITAGFNFNGGNTNLLLAGSFSNANPLLTGDRGFEQRARALTLARNPSAFYGDAFSAPSGATTNIAGLDPDTYGLTNLTLKNGTPLNSPFTSVPRGYAGPNSDNGAGLASAAGGYNFNLAQTAQSSGARQSLLNSPETESFSGTLRHQFTPDIQAFLDTSYSRNRGSFLVNNVYGLVHIPAGVPGNPFNQDIYLNTPAPGADQESTSDLRTYRGSTGVILGLPHGWHAEADITWSQNRFSYKDADQFDQAGVINAISDGTLDVFRDFSSNPPDFSQYLVPQPPTPVVKTSLTDFALRASGDIWSIPGGAITLSALLEHRKEDFGAFTTTINFDATNFQVFSVPGRSQSVDSVYSELLFPIVGAENKHVGLELLEFQVAGRWDSYTSNGANALIQYDGVNVGGPVGNATNKFTSVDPTVGLRFKPFEALMLRASFGTGFLPPNVNELVPQPTPGSVLSYLTDPLRGNEPLGSVDVIAGGNSALKPEKSKSWSAGMVFAPKEVSGLRLSADFTRIKKTDNIVTLYQNQQALQELIGFAPNRVTRGAPSDGFSVGPITALDLSAINFAKQTVDAYDFAVGYTTPRTRLGAFSLSSNATYIPHNQTQLSPDAPVVENSGAAFVGGLGSVKWRGNTTVTWDSGPWTVSWSVRYFSGYFLNTDHTEAVSQGAARVPSQSYHDLFASYKFNAPHQSALSNFEVQLGITDIFNTRPPVDTSTFGGYSLLGDPRLASYSLSVRKGF